MARVLLIEPIKMLADTYVAALEAAGFDVACVESAQRAITLADKTRPDVVVFELQLTGHSGLEFLYEFRSYVEWKKVPMIILSHIAADDSGLLPAQRQQLAISAYLYKPDASLETIVRAVTLATQLQTVEA